MFPVVSNSKIDLCILVFGAVYTFSLFFFLIPMVKVTKYETVKKRVHLITAYKIIGFFILAAVIFGIILLLFFKKGV